MKNAGLPIVAACMLLAAHANATDLVVGNGIDFPGNVATVPVTIANDGNDLSLVIFTVSQPSTLPAPTAVAGGDQANLLPADVFVDDLGGDTYRVTALVRSGSDMSSGAGNAINLQYDLTGVPFGTYPIE